MTRMTHLSAELGALPVTLDDVERGAGAARGRRPADAGGAEPGAVGAGRRPGRRSSARTSSAPARSRSAAPTPGSRGCRRRSGPAGSSPPARATTRRASRSPAQLLGIRSTVFMPDGAPIPKVQATRAYGAEVRVRRTAPSTSAWCTRGSGPTRPARCSSTPSTTPDIVAGQGTVGLEILEQVPDVRTVLVCTAAAGCSPGSPPRSRRCAPTCGSSACRPRARRPTRPRCRPGSRCRWRDVDDGRRHRGRAAPATCRSRSCRRWSTSVVTVSEELTLAGPAVPARAGQARRRAGRARPASPPCSTPSSRHGSGRRSWRCCPAATSTRCCMLRVIRHGMAAAGPVPAGPAAGARPARAASRPLLGVLAGTDANVLEVEHVRTGVRLSIDEVEIALQLETRGPDHCRAVLRGPARRGLPAAGLSSSRRPRASRTVRILSTAGPWRRESASDERSCAVGERGAPRERRVARRR